MPLPQCRSEYSMYMAGKKKIRTAVILWLTTISYMGLIFYLSSRHHYTLPAFPDNFDKVVHMCAYIPLAYLLSLSMIRSGLRKYVFLVAFIFASIYGVTDELHQAFVPGRDPAVGDVLADSLGAFLGSLGASFSKT